MDIERSFVSKLEASHEMHDCWEKGLRPEAFIDPQYAAIFSYIVEFWHENHMEHIPTREILKYEFPAAIFADAVEEPLSWLTETLMRKYASNQVQEIVRESLTTVHEDPVGTLSTLWQETYKASQVVAPRYDRVDFSQNVQERRNRYQERLAQGGLGLPYGLAELDDHTSGLLPGELAIVSAYAKTGKSFWLPFVATSLRRAGHTPIIFTLELSKEEMEDRVDAFASGVSYDRLIHSRLSPEEMTTLLRSQELFEELGPLHIHRPPPGERTVVEMIGRARQLQADYVLIDQLSWMDSEKKYYGDKATTMKHGDLAAELKTEIANETAGKLPCLLAVQQGRSSMEGQQRPEMWKIANSSGIEQAMDIAFGLSRTAEMRANRSMRFDIMGSRRSDDASWLLQWHLQSRTEISVLEEIHE